MKLHTFDGNCQIVREKFRFTFGEIKNTLQFRATLRNGRHTNYGGYPLYLSTSDGAALCFECAKAEYKNVSWSIRNNANDGWRVIGCDINYEDNDLCCDNCWQQIESAYGDDE